MADLNSDEVLQKKIDKIFREYSVTDENKPFLEFNDSDMKETRTLLQQLAAAGTVLSTNPESSKEILLAVDLASDSITNKKVNPNLVRLALGIYLTHSKEAHHLGLVVPSIKDHADFQQDDKGIPMSNPVTADTMKGVEILAYFREDYDFNDHHYHWHLVYSHIGSPSAGEKLHRVINRQGELFLYMHSQMIARYNAELLSWGLNMTHAWGYDDVLTFGYTPPPGLRNEYMARPAFRGWFENHNPNLEDGKGFPSKKQMISWRNNIFKAIESGFFYTKKSNDEFGKLVLTEENAMNWVGIVIEAEHEDLQEVSSGEYIDRILYGSVHNYGHNKFAEIDAYDKNRMGVMGRNIGSPRDPCFWLWHRHIDDFRQEIVKKYDHNLGQFQPKVLITELKICPQDQKSKTPAGGIATFLGPPKLELKEVNAKINHEPYKWELTVKSFRPTPPDESNPQTFTVRLFIAPKVLIQDQRSWIEMDKFTHTITKLSDKITRLDTVSSVSRKTPKQGEKLSPQCLCGWPQNMMLPIGTPEGMPYVGFAMLTDDKLGKSGTQALSFCGASDNEYPDPRGMGYPFDKTWASRSDSTSSVLEIIEELPQVKLCEFKIYRYTKLFQGSTSQPHPHPHPDITWENKIQSFFTPGDITCMKEYKIDLSDKKSVQFHAGEIYDQVEGGTMPRGEHRWSKKKVDEFKQWMDDGTP